MTGSSSPRPRFTIARGMLAIAGVAGVLEIVRTEIGGPFAVLMAWGGVTWGAWRVARRGSGWALAVLGMFAVPVGGVVVWQSLVPPAWIGPALSIGLAVATAPWLVAPGWAWFLTRPRRAPLGTRATPLLVLTLMGFPLATALTQWPLFAASFLVRPGLDRLADRVAAGAPVAWPQRVGPYTFIAGAVDPANPRNVALFIDTNPNGPFGLVRQVGLPPQPGTVRMILPTAYDIDLGGGWHLMSED